MEFNYAEVKGPTVLKHFSSQGYHVSFPVRPEHHEKRLDLFLQEFFPSFSRRKIQQKIALNEVQIVGRSSEHRPSTKLKDGQQVEVRFEAYPWNEISWGNETIQLSQELPIIFEDENLVVVNKPAFMATHPTGRHLFYCANVFLEERFGRSFHSVHRLDRETTGVLLFPKNKASASAITRQFEQGLVKKAYIFLAYKKGAVPEFPFIANERLGPKKDFVPRLFSFCYPEHSLEGKEGQTEFHLLAELNDFLVVMAFPKTGRQHQIRVHAAHHGLPLVGDKLYSHGSDVFIRFQDGAQTANDYAKMILPRHALHCLAMQLEASQKHFYLAPPQDDLQQLMNQWGVPWSELAEKAKSLVQKRFAN